MIAWFKDPAGNILSVLEARKVTSDPLSLWCYSVASK
jgi:hypothetical protein